MEFKDENGSKLYGYSQIDLEKHTKALEHQTKTTRIAVIVGGTIAGAFLLLCMFILYQIMRYNLFTAIVKRCVC